MKLKINIEKYSNYSSDADKEVIKKEIEFDDKMFDEITRPLKTKKKVKKCLWCATFDDRLIAIERYLGLINLVGIRHLVENAEVFA